MVHLHDTPNTLLGTHPIGQAPEVNAWSVDEIPMGREQFQQNDSYMRDTSYMWSAFQNKQRQIAVFVS